MGYVLVISSLNLICSKCLSRFFNGKWLIEYLMSIMPSSSGVKISSNDVGVCRNGNYYSSNQAENSLHGVLIKFVNPFIQLLLNFTLKQFCGLRGYLLSVNIHQKSSCIMHNRTIVNDFVYTVLHFVKEVIKEGVGHGQRVGTIFVELALFVVFLTDSLWFL